MNRDANWVDWIDKQANLSYPPVEEESGKHETAVVQKTAKSTDFDLQIVDVTVSATAETEETCDVDIQFALSAPGTMTLPTQPIPYQIELQTIDLTANTINQRSESEILHLQPEIREYSVRKALPMPAPGRYELQTVLYMHSPAEKIAYHIGPTLNIV